MDTGTDARGQTSPIGVVLVLAIVAMGTTAVVVLGAAVLDDTERASQLERGVNEMTLFDSRAATVALGESPGQRVKLGADGSYHVDSDTGWIRVTHRDWNDAGEDEEIYNKTMGAVVLENGGTTIAYQGGGVWRKGPTGQARMASPPEFHYRGSTLTLPAIRVSGSGGASGAATVHLKRGSVARDVYPNPSTNYTGNANRYYLNPAENGSMSVTVRSEYYEGWAQYFRQRTEGTVHVYDSNNTVTVELITLGDRGDFGVPGEHDGASAGSVTVRGLKGGHTLQNFTIVLQDDTRDNANMDNLKWTLFAENGRKEIELHLRDNGNEDNDTVRVALYYSDDDGDTYSGFKNGTAYVHTNIGDVNGDGKDERQLVVNFTDETKVEYGELSKSWLLHYDNPDTLKDEETWGQHSGVTVTKNGTAIDESVTFERGDTTTMNDAVNHYFALMGTEFDLKVDDKDGDTVDEGASQGRILYPGTDRYITYAHITENELVVEFE